MVILLGGFRLEGIMAQRTGPFNSCSHNFSELLSLSRRAIVELNSICPDAHELEDLLNMLDLVLSYDVTLLVITGSFVSAYH
jgi:hypothetical protein